MFQYDELAKYFSYLLWNINFLENVTHFFPELKITDDLLAEIEGTPTDRRKIVGILSYVAIQARDLLGKPKSERNDPHGMDSVLLGCALVQDRLTNANVVSDFKDQLRSESVEGLAQYMNEFVQRERWRVYERTAYMSFLLPFEYAPNSRQHILQLLDLDREDICEPDRWRQVHKALESFLQAKD